MNSRAFDSKTESLLDRITICYPVNYLGFGGAERQLVELVLGLDKARFLRKVRHFLDRHRDHITILKLWLNEQLTPQDLSELEAIFLAEGVGTTDDLERVRTEEGGLGLFVRSLVGLDRDAAKAALGVFLERRDLTANQIEFLDKIVDHLTERGVMEADRLYESPFTDIDAQGASGLFPTAEVRRLAEILDDIKRRTAA